MTSPTSPGLDAASLRKHSFVVVGARGFVGGEIARVLQVSGARVKTARHDESFETEAEDIVVYCSGIPFGAGRDPEGARRVHCDAPRALLERLTCSRFVYLSSTRVYDGMPSTVETVGASDVTHHDAYVGTKRKGEQIVLADERGCVVRLANVFGHAYAAGVFLSDILRQAAREGRVAVHSGRTSEKDYVSVVEAATSIALIGARGAERIYNVATGKNTTHADIFSVFERLGIPVDVPADALPQIFAPIDIARLRAEFPAPSIDLLGELPELLDAFRLFYADAGRS